MKPPCFVTDLQVELLPNGKTWRLTESLVYDSKLTGALVVPAGFETDFASVPRLPLAYLLAGDTAHKAAVVHDYLYQGKLFRRDICDNVFLEAMRVTGVVGWRSHLMYAAVRLFGGFWYA